MAKWEFAIACRDEADLASGHKRKKEGDIIAVKPYPWQWGNKEVNAYLMVIVDGLTQQEAHDLCKPQYEDGSLNPVENMEDELLYSLRNTQYLTDHIDLEGNKIGPSQIRTDKYCYVCIESGVTGEVEPAWPTKVVAETTVDHAAEVYDGTVQWLCFKKCDIFPRRPLTPYVVGDIALVQGWAYWCKKAGASSEVEIPEFEKKIPTIINDGTVQWKCKGKKNPKATAKRNFKFQLAKLKSDLFPGLDIDRVNDIEDVYQPLKDADVAIDAETMTMVYDIFNDKLVKKAVDPFVED